jgi:CheY-like chemotaxis protein
MDCMMPEMNGYEATAVIRDETSGVRNHAIPVIALTAKAFIEDQRRCLSYGMNDYLTKPLDVNKLLDKIEQWTSAGAVPAATVEGGGEDVPGQTGENEIFEETSFLERTQNDRGLAREIAAIFIEKIPEYLESIRSELSSGNAAALSRAAHRLKGSAGTLSLLALSELAEKIEVSAEAGDLATVEQYMPMLESCLERAATALRELVGKGERA